MLQTPREYYSHCILRLTSVPSRIFWINYHRLPADSSNLARDITQRLGIFAVFHQKPKTRVKGDTNVVSFTSFFFSLFLFFFFISSAKVKKERSKTIKKKIKIKNVIPRCALDGLLQAWSLNLRCEWILPMHSDARHAKKKSGD